MTTQINNFAEVFPNSSTAIKVEDIRSRIRGYIASLVDVGLTQTADTGQLDFVSDFAVDGTNYNQNFGFVILQFNDALAAEFPIYLKFAFSTGGNAMNGIIVSLDVGAATDGAGNITDRITAGPAQLGYPTDSSTLTQARRLLTCHTDSFAGAAMPSSTSMATGPMTFAVCRTVDSNGASTGQGVFVIRGQVGSGESAHFTCARYTPHGYVSVYDAGGGHGNVIYQPFGAYVTVDGEIPTYLVTGLFPDLQPVKGLVGIWPGSMSVLDTFQVAMVGNTPRTYINPGINGYYLTDGNGSTGRRAGYAMLWE